jgi:superfamily II DNA or RNA helicase
MDTFTHTGPPKPGNDKPPVCSGGTCLGPVVDERGHSVTSRVVSQAGIFALRPYQKECVEKVCAAFREFSRLLAVVPTGGGKTIIFSALAAQATGRVLIVAHREELISQAAQKLLATTGIKAEVERAGQYASLDARVVVASVQTLHRRHTRFPADHFSLIIVDEAHHALADSYQTFLQYFLGGGAKVLGVTATPDIKDKRTLGCFFQSIAYEIGILDLIRQGYLAPIQVQAFPLKVDLSQSAAELGLGVVSNGDVDGRVSAHALEPYLDDIAARLKVILKDMKTLIFVPLVSTAQKMVEACIRQGLTARAASGESENRREILQAHGTEFQVLINSMLLTEGYDCPDIEAIVPLRFTRSRPLFSQMVGRGTRLWCPHGCTGPCSHPDRKKDLLLVDVLYLHGEMQLVRAASLVTGNAKEQEHINEAVAEKEAGPLLGFLRDAVAEREAKLAERMQQMTTRKPNTLSIEEWALLSHLPELADYQPTMAWHKELATAKQLETLDNLNIDTTTIRTKGQASAVLDSLLGRRERGLATVKQVRLLQRYEHPAPLEATIQEASEFIDRKMGRFRQQRFFSAKAHQLTGGSK